MRRSLWDRVLPVLVPVNALWLKDSAQAARRQELQRDSDAYARVCAALTVSMRIAPRFENGRAAVGIPLQS
jgi:hypothetical protein